MVCYNHNPQGVSFESCDTHFLCSDAPEPEPESQHDRALELELARILKPELNELAQHMVGGWIIQMAHEWIWIAIR